MKSMLEHIQDLLKVSENIALVRLCMIKFQTFVFLEIDITAENPHKQINLQNISALNKFSRVTSLDWGDSDEILIGRANKFVKIYDANDSVFTSNIEMIDAPIIGLARYEGRLIAGIGNGKIQVVAETPIVLETGNHLSKLRQCPVNKKLVATGGKERQNNIKVWDLETQKRTFTSKNLPHDYLQLEVPVWDSDVLFSNEHELATCSRYGYIRRYDTRAQRRPVVEYNNSKEQISYTSLAAHENMIYAAASTGIIRAFDFRRLKIVAHTYKGYTGSISDIGIDETGKYLYSSSLDRFVRVHCSQSTALLYQCYVKSKATKILLRNKTVSAADSLNDTDCVFMGEVNEEDDDEPQQPEENGGGSDPEFDELFENMDTIRYVAIFFY